ncbi:hypothetical protein [Paucibacter sp. PLA-PC-4]|uniref:hypothetical protein n=1 Tax=Paucibacter sp. PLA-PC-4 TaxID=2993655 RepID=UPI00224A7254|nr:hypothetical protein [Paucibacter sp. PLA-PC-4]
MNRWRSPAIVFAALTLLAASASAAQVLKIFVEPDPPFVLLRDGKPAGPYLEALQALLVGHKLSLQVTLMPHRRISAMLPISPGSCGLAIDFSPGEAETLSFVGRVAPVKLAVYALKGAPSVRNIEDLRPYRVGAVDTAEVRDLLGAADIAFEPIAPTAQRTGMLQRKRFDYLVSDERPGMLDGDSGAQVQRVFVLARVDRWMACHAGLPPALLATLRLALQEGLFAESVRPIWVRAGLRPYYQAVRSEWELIPKSPANAARRPDLPP